ncbi:1797_t:CDS:2 [Cetraspora pellucida]|uniref:1797_t:CDS:1 n=1 Tax=Cetraspora pellucida TaxID=1433469 RepID=A0A9N9DIA6_9GLOM|nr:1797_t:CDS:2 [Cetraspora pellucida]
MISRQITLTISYLSILLISCVSGTHYLFSAYSTEIQERLDFSSIQINTIGSACNYGVYLSKPALGYFADHYGARRVCLAASILIFFGFFCLALTYEQILPSSFLLCAFYLFCAGVASSGGAVSFLTTIAKNFSSHRGTAISIPLALLGLSAFIYSQANLYLFEDTFHFLLFVAFTSGLCMFVGSLFLIVVPAPHRTSSAIESGNDDSISIERDSVLSRAKGLNTEQTPLLNKNISTSSSMNVSVDNEPDISGWQLFHNKDAISLTLILVFLAGTGLMYINNVGTIIESLYHASPAHPSHPYSTSILNTPLQSTLNDDIKKLQSFHVSLLSVCSCLGRILIGPLSDIAKNYFNLSRICSLIFAGVWLFCGNLLALLWARNMAQLWIVTTCIGLGFGILYGVAPTTCSEYFGSKRFGFNCTISCLISICIAYRWFAKVQGQRERIEN